MKRLKIVVVGAKFGEIYLQTMLKRKDLFEVVGILGKGGQHSSECSIKYNIPLYTSANELPPNVDLACVILRAGVMGGEGIQLSKELLQKGIHILHEQPVHYNELSECYAIAKKKKLFMGVSNLYRYIDATQEFIGLVEQIKAEERIEYINVECGHQILYPVLSILFDLTDYIRPFNVEQVITEKGPFDILYCSMNDIPCIIKIHNEVNSNDPDNFFYLFYRINVGFENGELQLEDPAGPVLWYSRFVIPSDFHYEEKSCKKFDKKNAVVIYEGSSYYDIFWNKWQNAIIKQILEVSEFIIHKKSYNSNMQRQLYQSRQWHIVMKSVGYPREKKLNFSERQSVDRVQEYIYKKHLLKCDFAYILSRLNREKVLEIKNKLDKACLYSMLNTLHREKRVVKGETLELEKIYNWEYGKKDFSYIIKRWIKALADSDMIIQENDRVISRVELCDSDVENAWEDAKKAWVGYLSDSIVIDYYYRNAKHLRELLTDNLNATYLLFTEGKIDGAIGFYENSLIARYLNYIISEKISQLYSSGMTILEIGAGTGAGTELILDKIDNSIEYIFTDLSSYFLSAAQERFTNFSNVEYQILNIDKDFSMQGIKEESIDMVVASGMLNNALDTEFTLGNIWKVLKEGGFVFIAEPVDELLELQISQVFMMTRPIDLREKYNQTFFDECQWSDILQKSNFEIVDIFPPNTDMLSVLQQKLFIGRKVIKC